MKKLLLVALMLLVSGVFFGCGQESSAKIDLDAAKSNIEVLTAEDGSLLYGSLTVLSDDELKLAYGIDTTLMSESAIYFSEDLTQASMFAVIKPQENKTEAVQDQLDTFLENYEYKWTLYLPQQASLVQNALVNEQDGYLIVIISTDNDAVLEAIEAARK